MRYKITIDFTTQNNEDLDKMNMGEFMDLIQDNLSQINDIQIVKLKSQKQDKKNK